jgi:hypothetical protein
MVLSSEFVDQRFETILLRIEDGEALRQILKSIPMSASTFYEWLEGSEVMAKRYARACELRADAIFDEIIEIADDSSQDGIETDNGPIVNSEFVQRSRLRVDTRKWIVAKLNPKKYGDKNETTHIFEKPIFTGINLDVH